MRAWFLVIVGLMILPAVASAQTPEATVPPAVGLESSIARVFERASNTSTSIVQVEIRIAQFESASSASNAIEPWFEQLRQDPYDSYRYQLDSLRPVSVEQIANETRALVATAPQENNPDAELQVVVLAVRVESTLFTFVVWDRYADRLDETVEIAKITLGLEPAEYSEVPNVPYETGGLWDLAPRIEDMPQGLTWSSDYVPCNGVFGSRMCVDTGTPVASPVSADG